MDAGADLDAKAAANAGGVPGGSALLHAAVFGFTDVVDLLAAWGTRIDGIVEAAAVVNIESFLTDCSRRARPSTRSTPGAVQRSVRRRRTAGTRPLPCSAKQAHS